ncbi:MAG: carbohydrate kinase [Bacteroidales bacterium]|jgi:fructokinase|nr:carbohydrate kinase [Bacteroidales bacterium]
MKRPLIIGLGEVLWDMLPEGKQLGGAPANVAFHARQLGADAVVVSAVGEDSLGNEIIKNVNKKQLRHHLTKTEQPTGTVEVKLHNGIPDYTIGENVAWDYIQYTPELKRLTDHAAAVCFGSLAQRSPVSQHTIQKILSQMPKNSIKLFDINIRKYYYTKETISLSLKASNVLKINYEELGLLSALFQLPSDETEKLRAISKTFGIKLIALTKGEKGSVLYTDSEISCLEATPVQLADTIGAGDSFSATLLMGLIHKKALSNIHRQAAQVSAFVCSQHGATPQLPRELIY